MFLSARILVLLSPIFLSFACSKKETVIVATPEKAPIQTIPNNAFSPSDTAPILHIGGTGASFSSALQNIAEPKLDAKSRAILGDLGGPKAIAPSGRSLKNTHIFAVLIAQPGTTGLFAGGTNNYNDYIQFDIDAQGSINGRQENQPDARQNFYAPAQTLTVGKPYLLELHPLAEDRSQLLINGKEIARISSLQSLNYFASGYRGIGSASELAELRFYENLSPEQQTDLSFQLRSYWDLPGGMELRHHDKLRGSLWLTKFCAAAASDLLTLRLSEPIKETQENAAIVIAESQNTEPISPRSIDPETLTLIAGQTWTLQSHPSLQQTPLHWSFLTKKLLVSENLGMNGSYVLLHRNAADQPWAEISASSPDANGLVHFTNIPSTAGEYTLAIHHGIDYQETPSTLVVNGKSETPAVIAPGLPFEMKINTAVPQQQITVTEMSSGVKWYDGPAESFHLTHRIFRQAETKLVVQFSTTPGYHAKRQEISILLDSTNPRLYPGLLAQFIAKAPMDRSCEAKDFVSDATWPAEKGALSTDYPAFRTAESIHPNASAKRPSYHHLVLPSLSLTSDKEKIPNVHSYPRYPGSDLNRPTRITGFLIPDQVGAHAFTLEINRSAKLTIGDVSTRSTSPQTLHLDCNIATLAPIPFELIVAAASDATNMECQLLWKFSSMTAPVVVPNRAWFHPVDAVRERALAQHTGQFSQRYGTFLHDMKDAALPAMIAAEKPEALQVLKPLVDAFLEGEIKAGDLSIARAAMGLIRERNQAMRAGKLNTGRPEVFIGNIRGDDLALYNAMQPFLFAAENHPALQQEALETRADIVSYLLGTIFGRPFLNETNWGANDCYGGEHNFAGAVWPAAQFIDSPYAWDAACNFIDNHFRFCPGNSEGLHADGAITFHNVNGRQMHFSGYGRDWITRIGIGKNAGSPWCMTPEQFRRLSTYAFAYEWFLYQDTYSFLINGRHNSQKSPGSLASQQALSIARTLLAQPAECFHTQDRVALEAMVKRIEAAPSNSIQGNHFFYRNLASVQRGKDFYIEAKMLSPLIAGPETFAGAVPWNMGYGDGFTALMRYANEYASIHRNAPNAFQHFTYKGNTVPSDLALWAYAARPGLTQLDSELTGTDRYRSGSGTYAGGTSDGSIGSMGYESNAKSTHHCKFYAFTSDGFASLTTDITATDTKHAVAGTSFRTNLNQCEWRSAVVLTKQNGESISIAHDAPDQMISLPLDQRYLVQHDGIAYLILPTGSEIATGKAGAIDLNLSTRTPLTALPGYTPTPEQIAIIQQAKLHETRRTKVFHLSINHGSNPQQAQAAYFVSMTVGDQPAIDLLENPPIKVLQNRPDLQALSDVRDGSTHAIFRAAGEVNDANEKVLLKTPVPLVMLWRPEKQTLTVQDPRTGCTGDIAQFLGKTSIEVLGKSYAIEFPAAHQPDDRFHGEPLTIPLR